MVTIHDKMYWVFKNINCDIIYLIYLYMLNIELLHSEIDNLRVDYRHTRIQINHTQNTHAHYPRSHTHTLPYHNTLFCFKREQQQHKHNLL